MSYVYELFKRFYNWIMGLANKQKPENKSFDNPVELDKSEIEFILTKLRLSTYKGDEFEKFYSVWVKLSEKLEKLS